MIREANKLLVFVGRDTASFDGALFQLHLADVVLFEDGTGRKCCFGRPLVLATTRAGRPRSIVVTVLCERLSTTEEHRAKQEEQMISAHDTHVDHS